MSGNASTSQDGVYIYGLFIEGWDGWLHAFDAFDAFDAIWISTETCSIQVPCMRCTLGLWHPHGAPSNLIVKYCEMWKSPNKSPENCKSVSVRILFQTELLISIDICIFVSDSCPTAVRQLSRWFVTFQALQVQESQPKVLFTDLPPLWFLPVKESPEDESYWVIDSIVKIAKARKARWVRGNWRN